MAAGEEEIRAVRDVGPVIAAHVHAFFAEPRNREVIEALRRSGVALAGCRARPRGGQGRVTWRDGSDNRDARRHDP